MKVHLLLDNNQSFFLPPSETLVEFLDGMAADYGDAAHSKAADAMECYQTHGDIPRSSLLLNDSRRLDEISNIVASAAIAVRKQLDTEKGSDRCES